MSRLSSELLRVGCANIDHRTICLTFALLQLALFSLCHFEQVVWQRAANVVLDHVAENVKLRLTHDEIERRHGDRPDQVRVLVRGGEHGRIDTLPNHLGIEFAKHRLELLLLQQVFGGLFRLDPSVYQEVVALKYTAYVTTVLSCARTHLHVHLLDIDDHQLHQVAHGIGLKLLADRDSTQISHDTLGQRFAAREQHDRVVEVVLVSELFGPLVGDSGRLVLVDQRRAALDLWNR